MVNPYQINVGKNCDPAGVMNTLLWNVIDIAATNPEIKPDPRIWPHLLVYAPDHIKQRLKALFKATGKDGIASAEEQPDPPAKKNIQEELAKMHAQLVEVFAKKHYESWAGQDGYMPWQDGGNSDKQEEARDFVRPFVDSLTPETFYPVNSPEDGESSNGFVQMNVTFDYSPLWDEWLKLCEKKPEDRDYFNMWTGQGIPINAVENPKQATEVADAMDTLKVAMKNDPGYAWSWHCAIFAGALDEGLDRAAANRAALRVMQMAFGIDTSANQHFDKSHLK